MATDALTAIDWDHPGYRRECWYPSCPSFYNAGKVMAGLESAEGWLICRALGLVVGCPEHNGPWRDGTHNPTVRTHDCSCGWRMDAPPSTLGAFESAYLAHLAPVLAVEQFNRTTPVGTAVTYWPGFREGDGRPSCTRTPAWLVSGVPCVSVEGYPGGIALTHVEVTEQSHGMG